MKNNLDYKVKNPFSKFLQNILLGLILILVAGSGCFLGSSLFNFNNSKVDQDVNAMTKRMWLATYEEYNFMGQEDPGFYLAVDNTNLRAGRLSGKDPTKTTNDDIYNNWKYQASPDDVAWWATDIINNYCYGVATKSDSGYALMGIYDRMTEVYTKVDKTKPYRVQQEAYEHLREHELSLPTNPNPTTGAGYDLYPRGWYATVGDWTTTYIGAYYDYEIFVVYIGELRNIYFYDGSEQIGNKQIRANSYLPKVTVPTKEGYTFAGYYTSPNGEGTQYWDSNGRPVAKSPSNPQTTYYAYWITDAKTITYLPNGGTVSSATQSVTNGQTVTLPNAEKEGY
ncbi:MAG: InlB B-repeat-containing protein [Clostridia bacterium]|nr:InlB B-repeat-containing protein [Clostridia bacterium]